MLLGSLDFTSCMSEEKKELSEKDERRRTFSAVWAVVLEILWKQTWSSSARLKSGAPGSIGEVNWR